MRKDAGLNGDLDRIPQLAWLLFLKAFDDLEETAGDDAEFRPAIEAPYRWRDWAADPNGAPAKSCWTSSTASSLPYLRRASPAPSEHDPRESSARYSSRRTTECSRATCCAKSSTRSARSTSTSSDDIHTMAHLYESMLREMRDAAGDSGEFYTPPTRRSGSSSTGRSAARRTVLDPAVRDRRVPRSAAGLEVGPGSLGTRNPPVPQAGSSTVSPSCGSTCWTMNRIAGQLCAELARIAGRVAHSPPEPRRRGAPSCGCRPTS